MMSSNYILDVNESDFEFEVIAHSENIPVVVDFWAEWCGPCKILGPILEEITEENGGDIRLARVDVDANPNLALRFGVRGIPAVKAFHQGQIVAEFVGVKPETQIREFYRQLSPSPSDLSYEKGQSLLELGEWEEAAESFYVVLEDQPEHPGAALGLAKSFLAQGRAQEALSLLKNFPPSREYSHAEKLRPVADAMLEVENGDLDTDNLLDAMFSRAINLIAKNNLPAALDGLLEILRQDKKYKDGQARKVTLGLFELLGEDSELTRQYQRELASILF